MFRRRYLIILLILIVGALSITAASAEDLNATDDVISQDSAGDALGAKTGTYTDLKNAIEDNYKGTLSLKRDYAYYPDVDDDEGTYDYIYIEKSITIYGNGHVIYANDADLFTIEDSAKVRMYNVTFYGEYSSKPVKDWGGAIRNWGNLYLEDCNFINCEARDAGGAISNSGDMTLVKCAFLNCKAKNEGGAIYNQWKARINTCYFNGNEVTKSESMGGAISNDLDMFINGSIFIANTAKGMGGAICTKGEAWIQLSIFGTCIENETYDESLIGRNTAPKGASIYNDAGKICTADMCFFNETDAEAVTNVIVQNSQFEDKSLISKGVIKNCTTNQTLTDTVNSTGFAFITTPAIETSYSSGEMLEVTVTSSPGGERVENVAVELEIDSDTKKIIMTDSNGVASYKASRLAAGNHSISIRLYNTTFCSDVAVVPVIVKETRLRIEVSEFTTTYASGRGWTIKVFDETNNRTAANVEIDLDIYTGSKSTCYSEKTDANGVATFCDTDYGKGLSAGTHKVILSTSQTGYAAEPVTSSIKVKAKKLYIAGETNRFKDCTQLILGAYDKQTGKMVSGIKLQVKIYTGKKCKVFNLVTKKSKAIGDIGVLIETNAFSAGKHKVTVKITSPNYKGSAKDKMVISKSAKKYRSFTYVISKGKGKYV